MTDKNRIEWVLVKLQEAVRLPIFFLAVKVSWLLSTVLSILHPPAKIRRFQVLTIITSSCRKESETRRWRCHEFGIMWMLLPILELWVVWQPA